MLALSSQAHSSERQQVVAEALLGVRLIPQTVCLCWTWLTLHSGLVVVPHELLGNGAAPDGHIGLQSQELRPDALLYKVSGCCEGKKAQLDLWVVCPCPIIELRDTLSCHGRL